MAEACTDTQTEWQKHRQGVQSLTCEELKDEHAAAHLLEYGVPDLAAALKAALADVQNVVAPHDPAEDEVDEGKGQDDRAGSRIGQGNDVDEHHHPNLPPIPDAMGPQSSHLISVRLGRPCMNIFTGECPHPPQ